MKTAVNRIECRSGSGVIKLGAEVASVVSGGALGIVRQRFHLAERPTGGFADADSQRIGKRDKLVDFTNGENVANQ